jgi:hypothetical protein
MPVAWMVFVEVSMQIPQRPMIGTVLSSAVEALLMRALMGVGELVVKSRVVRVIGVIVVRESRCHSRGHQHNCCRRKDFSHSHARSPLLRARRYEATGLFFPWLHFWQNEPERCSKACFRCGSSSCRNCGMSLKFGLMRV